MASAESASTNARARALEFDGLSVQVDQKREPKERIERSIVLQLQLPYEVDVLRTVRMLLSERLETLARRSSPPLGSGPAGVLGMI